MASALASDPINQLEENLQCTVCLEVLTDPRTLPCCHSFCKDCLERIVETCRGKAPRGQPIREFPCPYCRATFILDPNQHVADMPRNHFICNMVKVAAVLDRGTRVPCSHNCSQSYSVARCVTCEKFLCRGCLTGHNNYRGNNGHSVLTMEELSKPENRKKVNDKMYCNEHSGMELKVYCEPCNQLICRDCMDFKHVKQGHSCVLVKDEANKYKDILALNNKAMKDALTEGNAFLEQLTLTTKQLDRDAENAKDTIAQRKQFVAKKVLEMLDKKAESLCKELDQIHKGKRASLDKQTKDTKSYVENIKTSVELSKKLVDQGTEEEIISSQKMMLDNASNLLRNRKEYFKAPIPDAKLRYSSTVKEPINEKILRRLVNSLGQVSEEQKHAVLIIELPSKAMATRGEGNISEQLFQQLDPTVPVFSASHTPSTPAVSYSGAVTVNTRKDKTQDADPKRSATGDEECSICLYKITDKKTLDKCGHSFCADCIKEAFKHQKKCPNCGQVYGQLIGNQPPGKMTASHTSIRLPGYKSCGSIMIIYKFEGGVQGPEHPSPGKRYCGTTRHAYLPDNEEGNKVLKLLRKAFDQKLTFTIGRSSTTGYNNMITWNDIHHKTNQTGGVTSYGYPDPDYLKIVQEELAAKGITE